jgi:predicted ATPase
VALHVYGEYEYTVVPLAIPRLESGQGLAQLVQSPAVTLFVQRAQAVNPGFSLTPENYETVAQLCVQMEGIPLAVELIASHIKYFSPQALLIRISNSKRLLFLSHALKRLPPRQQTLRGMLDWSYILLAPELQILFNRLGVFAGGCTIEAATEICGANKFLSAETPYPVEVGLTALVDQSLLQQQIDNEGEPRFSMLGITREYALERLSGRGETADIQHAHALYYLNLVEHIESQSNEHTSAQTADLLQREYLNFKTALQWTLDNRRGEIGLRFVTALWEFWRGHGILYEGRQITQAVLDQTAGLQLANRAHVYRLVGWLAHDLRDYTTMLRSFQASLEISEELNDLRGAGLARQGLGELAQLRGQWEQAELYLEQSLTLFKQLDAPKHLAWSLGYLGRLAFGRGNLAKAQTLFQDSLDRFRAINFMHGIIYASTQLGRIYFYQGQFEQATGLFDECLAASSAITQPHSPMALIAMNYMGEIALHRNLLVRARELINICIQFGREQGYSGCLELGNGSAGLLAIREKDRFSAATYFRESLLLQQLLKEPWRSLFLLEAVAELLVEQTDLLGAARLYGAANHLRTTLGVPQLPLYQEQHAQSLSALRTQLNPATLDEAWAAGQSLTLEQAIAYALRCLE